MTNEQIDALMKLVAEQGKVINMCADTIDLLTKVSNKLQGEVDKIQVQIGDIEADSKTALYRIKKLEGK